MVDGKSLGFKPRASSDLEQDREGELKGQLNSHSFDKQLYFHKTLGTD